jgi:hypothetical protein
MELLTNNDKLYKIKAIIPKSKKNYIQSDNWGEFSVYKEFSIKHPVIKKEDIYGYIIQKVNKNTKVIYFKDDEEKIMNTTDDIMKFTSNQVNYSTKTYYELFFIIKGISTYADVFQNGPILHYNIEDKNDIYADDEVPTAGIISMIGESFFIEDIEDNVIKNSKKENPTILNIKWDTSENLPSNGLPYTEELPNDFHKKNSNILIHDVNVKWNGIKHKELNIFNKKNNKNKTRNNNNISNMFKKLNISNTKKTRKTKKDLNEHSIISSVFTYIN